MPEKLKIRKTMDTRPGMAPDPGYDKPPVTPERVDMSQPQYPETFAARLKGKPGNINAQSQLRKSKQLE